VALVLVQVMTRLSLTNAEPTILASSTVTTARSVPSQSVNTVSPPITENVRPLLTVIPRRESPHSNLVFVHDDEHPCGHLRECAHRAALDSELQLASR